MAVPTAYLTSSKNVPSILEAIQRASVPERFTFEFLKQLGFPSSNDRPIIPVLKTIGFLNDSSVPTERYRKFKDRNLAKGVLAQGIREGYADVFAIETQAHAKASQELNGIFARLSDKGESVTAKMASTFKTLTGLADFSAEMVASPELNSNESDAVPPGPVEASERGSSQPKLTGSVLTLRHDIHVHLPLSTDVAVYDAIFKSLKANL